MCVLAATQQVYVPVVQTHTLVEGGDLERDVEPYNLPLGVLLEVHEGEDVQVAVGGLEEV